MSKGLVDFIKGDATQFAKANSDHAIIVADNGKALGAVARSAGLALGHELSCPVRVQMVLGSQAPKQEGEAQLDQLKAAIESAAKPGCPAVAVGVSRMDEHFDDEEHGVSRALIDVASDMDHALIVVGTHKGGKPLTGTVTENLIRDSRAPILITDGKSTVPYQSVVVGFDFSPYGKAALAQALRWVNQGTIHVVHAHHPSLGGFKSNDEQHKDAETAKKKLEAVIAENRNETSAQLVPMVAEGKPTAVLHNAIETHKADAVFLGTHGRTGVSRAILGSVATKFVDAPPCDVIVIKPA